MRYTFQHFTRGLLVISLLAVTALSQSAGTGAISGGVTDHRGDGIHGASVEIFSEVTGKLARQISTGPDGRYSTTLLPPGHYRLSVAARGFKRTSVEGVEVGIGETARQDLVLAVGDLNENVDVEPARPSINAVGPAAGYALDAETLQSLPLASPNPLFLLGLSAGATSEPPDVRSASRASMDFSVNGQRTTNNSISLEGINVNDFNLAHFDTVPLPNQYAIRQLKFATSLYDASVGSKGGGAVAMSLQSGGKDFHAGVYLTHRNEALNANEWFRNRQGLPRARLLNNVFGGSAGGPVWKIGGFWFFNYQGLRERNGIDPSGSSLSPTVPALPTAPDGTTSAALLAAAFGTPQAPLTPAMIDPVAVNILNFRSGIYGGEFLIPRPGQSGCTGTTGTIRCLFSGIAQVRDDQYLISYDRSLRGGKDVVTGRWFWAERTANRPFATGSTLAFPQASVLDNRFLSLSHTHIFGLNKVNEFRFGFNRFNSSLLPTDSVTLRDVGATRANADEVPGIYRISLSGLFSLGTGVNDERGTVSNTFHWADTFSATRGRHTLRVGGEALRYQLNRFNRFGARGELNIFEIGDGYSSFANFLQGRLTGLQSASGDPQRYFRASDFAVFFQDDWRIHPRLSLSLGLRWEGLGFANDKYYRQSIYDARLAARGENAFLFPEKLNFGGFTGTPGVSDCAIDDCFDANNFGPRIGFAWDVKGDQSAVLRGGWGVFFQRLSNQNILQGALSAPFLVQTFELRLAPPAFQLANPFAGLSPSAGVSPAFIPQVARFAGLQRFAGSGPLDPNDPGVEPVFVNEDGEVCFGSGGPATNCVIDLASFPSPSADTRAPYTQHFGLSMQLALPRGWAAEAGYVGTRYIGGLGVWDPYVARLASPSNPVVVTDINGNSYTITANTPLNEPLRHRVLGLSNARGSRYIANIGQGVYHSLQLTARRRLRGGMYLQAAYTFSKSIDNVSGSLAGDELNTSRVGLAGAGLFNSPDNPQQNRARSDFDRPHALVVSYWYGIPALGRGRFAAGLLRGWSVSGIVRYQSGLPFATIDTSSGNAFGVNVGTGVFTCGSLDQAYTAGQVSDRVDRYLNPACFTTSPVVPFGTPGATGYGNIPRNAFRAPSQHIWDFSVQKRFRIGESHSVQLRADFFNLWNHPVFLSPTFVNVASPQTFGGITSTLVPARLIQLGLKYDF